MEEAPRNHAERIFVFAALPVLAFTLHHVSLTMSVELRLLTAWCSVALAIVAPGWSRREVVIKATCAILAVGLSLWVSHPLMCLGIIGALSSTLAFGLSPQSRTVIACLVSSTLVGGIAISSGIIWFAEERRGREVTSLVTSLSKYQESLTLSFVLGPWMFIALGVFAASIILADTPRSALSTGGLLVAIFVLTSAASLLLLTWIPLAVSAALAIAFLLRRQACPSPTKLGPFMAAASVVSFAFALLAGLPFGGTISESRKIAIIPIGLGRSVVEQGPFPTATLTLEAEFGSLVAMLRDQGWSVTTLQQDWTRSDIEGYDAVLAINVRERPSPAQCAAAKDFVRRGGVLLAAADHTDIMGVQKPFNELLGFTSIRIAFDSGMPAEFAPQWHKGLWTCGSLPASFDNSVSTGISVGATLSIGAHARPLIVGVKGFSDRGDISNGPGFLGDMRYNPGERFSGIVLAAEENVGEGHVVAWGDTSTFQNGSIPYSSGVILDCLTTRRPAFTPWLVLVGLVGFLLFMALGGFPAALVGAVAAAICTLAYPSQRHSGSRPHVTSKSAVFDTRFAPAYPGEFSEEKVSRFFSLFDRLSLPVYALDSVEACKARPKMICIAAPTKTISPKDTAELLKYVVEGGSLLVMTSANNRAQAQHLLRELEFDLAAEPLGGMASTRIEDHGLAEGVRASVSTLPHVDQEPANMLDSYELKGEGQVLIRTLGRPTCMAKKIGKGRVIVFSDSRFFSDKHLGEKLAVKVANARLMYEVIRKLL